MYEFIVFLTKEIEKLCGMLSETVKYLESKILIENLNYHLLDETG